MIKITIPGEPVRRISPTFSKYKTFDSQKPQIHAAKFYTLEQVTKYQNLPLHKDTPIELEIDYYFSIPNGKINLHNWGLLEHIDTPDTDNLCKFSLDVLKKIVFEDDRQVHILHAKKHYDEKPRTEINVMEKNPSCSDQVKEVLEMFPTESFVDIATHMSNIVELDMTAKNPFHLRESILTDYDEIAYLILELAERHADILKKINKKFPGLAKILKERMENK